MRKNYFIISIVLVSVLLIMQPVFSQNYNTYFTKANSMLVSGKLENAIENYKSAIKENNSFSEAYMGLGMAYKEMGRYREAYNVTIKAIELNPSYFQAYYNLGLICEKMGNNKEAVNSYEKFLKEVPGAERFSDAKQRITKLKKIL